MSELPGRPLDWPALPTLVRPLSRQSVVNSAQVAGVVLIAATVLVGGPLVMLAMLFPTAFGGWKRWLVLLSTAGTTSTLYALQWYFSNSLAGSWWGSAVTL